jgi:hypothetical protein
MAVKGTDFIAGSKSRERGSLPQSLKPDKHFNSILSIYVEKTIFGAESF